VALGFETDRLKTGTPSRVDARTIDYSALEAQPGDDDVRWFSFDPEVTHLIAAHPHVLSSAASATQTAFRSELLLCSCPRLCR
jgi:tRNA uridine 5-carboxymethylaminomethyl modification enzyme